jgi:hypothetical protein
MLTRASWPRPSRCTSGRCKATRRPFGADRAMTYIPALNTFWGLGALFERQADLEKARAMHLKALVGYEKVVGPDHPKSRNLQDNLHSLNTMTENRTLVP